MTAGDFYEDDEPVEDVAAAFDAGRQGTTTVGAGVRGWNHALEVLTIEDLFAASANAAAVRAIREWCDAAEAMACAHVSEDICRRREVIKDCAVAVRSLLPDLGEGDASG